MAIHERLDKVRGLAIFASDPISSNAYATEAVMSILIVIGSGALSMTMPIVMAIAALVLIVVFSYIQTILHYPKGGGSYIVAKDNLGTLPSLIAAGALLTDYSLTVSVSVSAGIRAIVSAFPEIYDYRVLLALGTIAILTWMNLRGVRESGSVFAFPTYAFIGGVFLVIMIGLVRSFGLFGVAPLAPQVITGEMLTEDLTQLGMIWILLRAFAAGCTALTGIEAISDGVQAFKPPEAKNAAQTMVTMGVIAMTLFVGISFLATYLNLIPAHHDSLLSQLTRTITGEGFIYYWVQIFTMLILVLAANTGYQDFPRLGYFLARDKFMPRWLTNQGDRLVFNGGIITLAIVSSIVVIIFKADEFAMLPLYAIGVMLSFTISQSGMVKLLTKVSKLKPGETLDTLETHLHHEKGWQWKRIVNALGATTTAIVFIVLVVTKFAEGAWIIVLLIPLIITMFYSIHRHYDNVSENLSTRNLEETEISHVADVVILPIGDVHRGTLRALQYAKLITKDVRAVYISTDASLKERFLRRWKKFPLLTQNVNLIGIDYDYRDVLTPLIEYIEHVHSVEFPDQSITVIIPEILTNSLLSSGLHNKTALLLRGRLRHYLDIIIIEIPFHILPPKKKPEFKLTKTVDEVPAPLEDEAPATD
ncbi:MAG: APC family permease [Anaerolineales bacterium]|uniref:APC family permease n=1 Tax=Candidatus Desulfolinea nitratireducens TaxID=2841698 RepID=A0A8J6NJ59_9CHLR|nr:APC family permease [Candidatus Desulfolinea nitratireducens]MBL6959783.1 APC family permease [Anaerolineales bacterium]